MNKNIKVVENKGQLGIVVGATVDVRSWENIFRVILATGNTKIVTPAHFWPERLCTDVSDDIQSQFAAERFLCGLNIPERDKVTLAAYNVVHGK